MLVFLEVCAKRQQSIAVIQHHLMWLEYVHYKHVHVHIISAGVAAARCKKKHSALIKPTNGNIEVPINLYASDGETDKQAYNYTVTNTLYT